MSGKLCVAVAALSGCASSQQPTVVWATRYQVYRDSQVTSPAVVYGPASGGVDLVQSWTFGFVPTPPGVLSEAVSDTSVTYSMSSYQRRSTTSLSAFTPAGLIAWSSDVPHGAMYYANMGLQLTAVGTLISHSVSSTWQAVTALNIADGSPAWTYNTSSVFDHVTMDPSLAYIVLTDYFGDSNGGMPGILILDAATGAPLLNSSGALCVSPIVTMAAIVCYCDGDIHATHLCGFSRDLTQQLWKQPAPSYFPSSLTLTWTQIGAVGYGAIVAPVVDANNVTRLQGFSTVDGTPTTLFPGAGGLSLPMPWAQPSSVTALDISISTDAATAFVSALQLSQEEQTERDAACDEAVLSAAARLPGAAAPQRWVVCHAAEQSASGRTHRCTEDCDLPPGGLQTRRRAEVPAPVQRPSGRTSSLRPYVPSEDMPTFPALLVAVGLDGAGCFKTYTVARDAGFAGFANTAVGPDGSLGGGTGTPGRAVLYVHGASSVTGEQVEAIGWDLGACIIVGGAGIAPTTDNGRYTSVGSIDGLIISSGIVFSATGQPLSSAVSGVMGPAHPFVPTPSNAPAAPAAPVGAIVGSLFGVALVGAGFFVWRRGGGEFSLGGLAVPGAVVAWGKGLLGGAGAGGGSSNLADAYAMAARRHQDDEAAKRVAEAYSAVQGFVADPSASTTDYVVLN
jgi:hypothetical protein